MNNPAEQIASSFRSAASEALLMSRQCTLVCDPFTVQRIIADHLKALEELSLSLTRIKPNMAIRIIAVMPPK